MTREEAIKIQKWLGNNHFLFASTFEDVKASTNMAIQSLEAWEKVKEEVEDKIGSLDDELKDGEVCLSYYYGKLAGLSEVLEIIDKHLSEVSE